MPKKISSKDLPAKDKDYQSLLAETEMLGVEKGIQITIENLRFRENLEMAA